MSDIVETDYVKTFGFNPQSIGNRYRHHWIVTEPDEDDERAGATTGCLCVRARDGASNPIDADACKHPNFIGTVEDDFDRTYRYYYYRPLTDADREDPAATITAFRKRVAELEGALADAVECVKDWGAYAGDYFREKHDLDGDLARLRANLKGGTDGR